jgi:hypothetical protein
VPREHSGDRLGEQLSELLLGRGRRELRGLEQRRRIPVRRHVQRAEIGGEERRGHKAARAAERADARIDELPVEERLDRVEVGLGSFLGAAQHLLYLGRHVDGVRALAVEDRLEAPVVSEGPEPGTVRDDASVGAAQDDRRLRPERLERGEHDVRRARCPLRRRAEAARQLAGVVECSREADRERVVPRERRLPAPLEVAHSEGARADRRDDPLVPSVRSGGEHALHRVGSRRRRSGQDRR